MARSSSRFICRRCSIDQQMVKLAEASFWWLLSAAGQFSSLLTGLPRWPFDHHGGSQTPFSSAVGVPYKYSANHDVCMRRISYRSLICESFFSMDRYTSAIFSFSKANISWSYYTLDSFFCFTSLVSCTSSLELARGASYSSCFILVSSTICLNSKRSGSIAKGVLADSFLQSSSTRYIPNLESTLADSDNMYNLESSSSPSWTCPRW